MNLEYARSHATPYAVPDVKQNAGVDGANGTTTNGSWSTHSAAYQAIVRQLTGAALPVSCLTYDNVTLLHVGDHVELDIPTHGGSPIRLTLLNRAGWGETPAYPQPADPQSIGRLGLSPSGWYFVVYPDQTLRRAYELDRRVPSPLDGEHPNVIGWRCAAKAGGFLAPDDFIPGPDGNFIPDRTVPVTLRVPPEFVQQCDAVGLTPVEVLRGFVADLAGVNNWNDCPRVDGYSSNGSGERDVADAYFDRAFGHLREQAEQEAQLRDNREQEEALASERRDSLDEMFEAFTEAGRGDHEAFLTAVREALNLDDATPHP